MQALREYFRVAIPLAVIFFVYSWTVVPWIELKPANEERTWDAPQINAEQLWWHAYFRDGAWQRDKKTKVANTSQGIILFQELIDQVAGTYKLSPLTLLVPAGNARDVPGKPASQRWMIIEAPEGAELRFKDKLDWTKDEFKIDWGMLRGPIQIASPPRDPSEGQGLLIDTRDVRIDDDQISTTNAVKISLNQHRIEGENLSIYFDRNLFASGSHKALPERMELIYVHRVELQLPPGGLWANHQADRGTSSSARPDSTRAGRSRSMVMPASATEPIPVQTVALPPAHLEIACRGSFQFDFRSSLATFQNGVTADHLVTGMPADRFQCDHLKLKLASSALRGSEPIAASTPPRSGWSIDALYATGKAVSSDQDPFHWVQLTAPGIQSAGLARSMELDLIKGSLLLRNRPARDAPPEVAPVYLKRETAEVWSPEIQYIGERLQASEKNKTTPPGHLGMLSAAGPGMAKMLGEDGNQWKISWSKAFAIQPDGDEDLVTIDGSANVRSDAMGQFSSERLDLWLQSLSAEDAKRLQMQLGTQEPNTLIAKRLQARGETEIHTPDMDAFVKQLRLWFVYPNIITASKPIAPRFELVQFTQPKRPPANHGAAAVQDKPPMLPLEVRGNSLSAQLMVLKKGYQLDTLVVEENVNVRRPAHPHSDAPPTNISGGRLQVKAVGEESLAGVIQGTAATTDRPATPARVGLGTGWIEGPEIQFDQSTQIVRVDHPGTIVVPPEMLSRPDAAKPTPPNNTDPSSSSSSIQWVEPLRIDWQERMIFQSQIAQITGNVMLHGRFLAQPDTVSHFEGSAAQLDLLMSEPVSGKTPRSQSREVHTIRLTRNVEIRTAETERRTGTLMSRARMLTPQLDFLMQDHRILAEGPGSIWVTRPDEDAKPTPNLVGPGQLASRPVAAAQPVLTNLHLTFDGRMEAFTEHRELRFFEKIEALVGPVQNWDELLNVTNLRQIGADQKLIFCDFLRTYSTGDLTWNQSPRSTAPNATLPANPSGGRESWELEAKGNVELEALSETGRYVIKADTAQYDHAKEIVTIKGTARSPATLSSVSNGKPSTAVFDEGRFNPRTGETDLKLRSAGTQLPDRISGPTTPGDRAPAIGTGRPLNNPRDLPVRQRRK